MEDLGLPGELPSELRSELYRCLPQEEDTDQILVSKLQNLYHLRHDIAHFLCERIVGVKSDFSTMKKLKDKFDFLPDIYSKLAPDIFFERDNTITFLDISVSANFEYNFNEKFEKYNPVLTHMSQQGFDTNPFYMIWFHPSWNNLDNTIQNLRIYLQKHNLPDYPISDRLLDKLKLVHEDISKLIQEVRLKVPIELLNFFDRVEQPIPDILSEEELHGFAHKSYPEFKEILNTVESSNLMEVEELFSQLVEDEEIINFIKDDKHDHIMYSRAFTKLIEMESSFETQDEKPSFFIPFAPMTNDIAEMLIKFPLHKNPNKITLNFKKEQEQVLRMLNLIKKFSFKINSNWSSFSNLLLENLEICFKHKTEVSIFNTGMLTGTIEEEMLLSRQYNEYKKENQGILSKRAFLKNQIKGGDLRDTLPYIYRNKCVKLPAMPYLAKTFVEKSGTSYKKTHNVREYQKKKTVDSDSYKHMENFIKVLNTKTLYPHGTHPFLGTDPGCDSSEMFNIKSILLEEQKVFLSMIQERNCHSMSKHSSLAATQLLHFNELNTSDNTYCCFTSGQPNVLHIVRGGSIKRGSDIGQAYFTVFVTDSIEWCSKVYGRIETTEINDNGKIFYICKTPWVRLTSERLSFMKDQYYSTLSTAYDTWARNKDFADMDGFFTHMYTFRACVSMSPSQRIAELLMDTRYIFMSALSTYSNVEKLIIDKFAPPYKNSFEQFIVRQLEFKCKQIILYLANHKPKPHRAGFNNKERLNHTLGGTITLPSLWSDFVLQDLQSIFDDIFVYVHTSKEPSSEYYEQVKAINTILKYQREFDKLERNMKHGLGNREDLKKWILSGSQVGCSSITIFQATKLFSGKYKGLHKSWDFKSGCTEEPLCNIVSTKACIPEYDRKIIEQERTKKNYKSVITNINSLMVSGRADYIVNKKEIRKTFYKLDIEVGDDAEIVITKQNRVKVHDALIDWIGRYGMDKNFVIDLATWNIRDNNCKVLTDTCIKAQYGAKREFYVINLGAKAMARVTENSYKSLAKICKNEMISIPGDRKLLHIQEALNDAILSSERRKDVLMYVNGDCTKWSACETMASFISMNAGLENVFGKTITNYNLVTFCSWANKEIQVPQTILQKLKFISESTKYLEEGTSIKSTQNFLQGMFNYSSSMKAVIATEFALYMFKKKNTNDFIHCSHLEHSDDYSLIVRTNNLQVFERFRIYHKLSQKLFGINDSIKKTNIQSHIQEFISLFSFNGQLYYPHIKKTKEVGTNLPCSDYRSDVMSITSRVSEAIRLGIALESAYFMQRVHCASLADAYSLSPGMKNSVGNVSDIFSRPIEMFGMPDTLPILSVVIKGNPDNYRIYNYGEKKNKDILKSLFLLGQETYNSLDLPIDIIKEDMGELYNPVFSYPTRHNRIKAIREKVKLTFQEAQLYMESNLTDSLVKPVETKRFHKWLKTMYFNKSFTKAYMRVSRSAMTLRHSMFSSKPCILEINSHLKKSNDEERQFTTIKRYIVNNYKELPAAYSKMSDSQFKLFDSNINCYNSCLQLIYSLTKNSVLVERSFIETHTTVNKMPDPFQWITLENNISNLLQFLVNPSNFYSDRRVFISETSLFRDIKKLQQSYNLTLIKTSTSYCRQVFSEIASQSNNRAYGLTFLNNVGDLPSFVKQYFENGMNYNRTYNMLPLKSVTLTNINTGLPFYIRDWKSNINTHTGILSQLALVYRCIILRTSKEVQEENLKQMLNLCIPELDTTVRQFLTDTDLKYLDGIKSGELARKILCFLKSKLLFDSLDLQSFVTSKFHYEVYYVPKRQVLKPFKEQADISFLNMKFRAYLYEEGKKSYIFIEMKNMNRVYWFYCYSIAQRIFGLINQTVLDERLLETRDFILPLIPHELKHLFSIIGLPNLEPIFFKKMGNVFRNTTDFLEADIPIVIQDVRVSKFFPKIKKLANNGNIHTTDLSVYLGNILLYKLPFGNLLYKNYFDLKDDALENIKIDSLPISLLIRTGLLEKYLKSDYDMNLTDETILNLFPNIVTNLQTIKQVPGKLHDIASLFNLDITHYKQDTSNLIPKDPETLSSKNTFKDALMLDINSTNIFQKDLFKNKVVRDRSEQLTFDFMNIGNDIELTDVDTLMDRESSRREAFAMFDVIEIGDSSVKLEPEIDFGQVKSDEALIELDWSGDNSSIIGDIQLQGNSRIELGSIDIAPNFEMTGGFDLARLRQMQTQPAKSNDDVLINVEQSEGVKIPKFEMASGFDLSTLKGMQGKDTHEPILDVSRGFDLSTHFNIDLDFGIPTSLEEPRIELESNTSINFGEEEESKEIDSKESIIEVNAFGTQLSESYLSTMLKPHLQPVDVFETIEPSIEDIQLLETVQLITDEGSHAREMSEAYDKMVSKRSNPVGNVRYALEMDSIEYNRDFFASIMDVDTDELGQLFDTVENVAPDLSQISDSDSDSSSGDISWFQLVPSKQLIEGVYNFDKRCQEALVNLNEYFLIGLIRPEMEEILRSKTDITLLITLFNYIKSGRSNVKLSKEHKGLIKLVFAMLKNILKENNNTCYTISNNIALKWVNNKINFLAIKGYEDKDQALRIASTRPNVSFERDVRNSYSETFWLSTQLKQRDLDNLLSKGFQSEEFSKRTQITRMLSSLIPRYKKTEFMLEESYDF